MATECFGTRYFMSWLTEQKISIAFSSYKSGDVFLVGPKLGEQGITVGRARYTRAMGMVAKENLLFLGTASQIWKFDRVGCNYDGFTSTFLPRAAYTTGDIDIHEMVIEDSGRLVFVNTLFSCLSITDEHASFGVLWAPPFISKLAPEDRCHINGVALRDGKARYVTMAAPCDVMGQWREQRHNGGMVMDISDNSVVAEGLSMPHSPRWHEGKLWLHNSGTGNFGFLDSSGAFQSVCFCPGYLRGLAFIGKYAVVGLSRMREGTRERSMSDLSLEEELTRRKLAARCGIYVIDTHTGNIEHALNLEGDVKELFDIVVLRRVEHADILDFESDHVNRLLTYDATAVPKK